MKKLFILVVLLAFACGLANAAVKIQTFKGRIVIYDSTADANALQIHVQHNKAITVYGKGDTVKFSVDSSGTVMAKVYGSFSPLRFRGGGNETLAVWYDSLNNKKGWISINGIQHDVSNDSLPPTDTIPAMCHTTFCRTLTTGDTFSQWVPRAYVYTGLWKVYVTAIQVYCKTKPVIVSEDDTLTLFSSLLESGDSIKVALPTNTNYAEWVGDIDMGVGNALSLSARRIAATGGGNTEPADVTVTIWFRLVRYIPG